MIDTQLELTDKYLMSAIGSATTTTLSNEYDFSADDHNLGLSGLRLRAQLSGDSVTCNTTIQVIVQDAPDSSGSSGTYANLISSIVHPAANCVAGFVLMDVGLPTDMQQWVRVQIASGANITTATYLNVYIYSTK